MKEYNKTCRGPKRKVVQREICSVLSAGTRTFSVLDKADKDGNPPQLLLSIFESDVSNNESDVSAPAMSGISAKGRSIGNDKDVGMLGFVVIDAASGIFKMGQFLDDPVSRSRLVTLLVQVQPSEIVFMSKGLSPGTKKMVAVHAPGVLTTRLPPAEDKCWATEYSRELLSKKTFLGDSIDSWPVVLQEMMKANGSDEILGTAGIAALGGALCLLRRCFVAKNLVSHRRFEWMSVDHKSLKEGSVVQDKNTLAIEKAMSSAETSESPLALDGTTLTNLEVFVAEGATGSVKERAKGSLFNIINHTFSPMGRRLLKQWICTPLSLVKDINLRLDTIEELMELDETLQAVRNDIRQLPDIERLLQNVHTLGVPQDVKDKHHPGSRAVMYEEVIYGKRKVKMLMRLLDGLKLCDKAVRRFDQSSIKSPLLCAILPGESDKVSSVNIAGVGVVSFPDIREKLSNFDVMIGNKRKALETGTIIPPTGTDEEYDAASDSVKEAENALEEYKKEQEKRIGQRIIYFGKNNNRYQMELPEKTKVPNEYTVSSKKKGSRRYRTRELEGMIEDLGIAEERLASSLRDVTRRLFFRFDSDSKLWQEISRAIALLDCISSLALVSKNSAGTMCRPSFIKKTSKDAKDILRVTKGWHPCVVETFSGSDFIPNSVVLGGESPAALLLTGPNMGGKSTLLRQTCIAVIMAQIGCYVPAESMELTPVDRIFTRLGASDKLMEGQSTFFVELSETSEMLRQATGKSLLIIDELGRGTSTFDGAAIASAVLEYLSQEKCCRTLFSTHYYNLVDRFTSNPRVQLGHMSSYVDVADPEQRVTFLYTLQSGACPKSYGINVARLARLPNSVVDCAKKASEKFEKDLRKTHSNETLTDESSLRKACQSLMSVVESSDDEFVKFFKEAKNLMTNV